ADQVSAILVQGGDQVGAVVHRHRRPVLQRGGDVAVVGVVVLSFDGEDADPVVRDQRGRGRIGGRERVGGAEHEVGATGLQGDREVGGFGGDVQAGGQPLPFEWLLAFEALADLLED